MSVPRLTFTTCDRAPSSSGSRVSPRLLQSMCVVPEYAPLAIRAASSSTAWVGVRLAAWGGAGAANETVQAGCHFAKNSERSRVSGRAAADDAILLHKRV